MEIDDLALVAETCAKAIHGDKALLVLAQNHPSYPPEKRWRATVIVRADTVEAKHAPKLSMAVKALAKDLASRSPRNVRLRDAVAIKAAALGHA